MDRKDYLACLGITEWRLRASPQDFYVYTLMGGERVVGVLVFDALLKNEEERALVRAMTEAIKRPYEGGFYPAWSPSSLATPPVVVALGAHAAALYRGVSSELIVTHGAATLLAEPRLKAEAWRHLQHAMGLMT